MENNQADPQLYTQPNPNFLQIADERPKKSFNYKALTALLISLVVGLLALLVYLFTQNQQLKQQAEATEFKETKTAGEVAEQVQADPTTGWETYSGNKYNLTFKHPTSFTVEEFADPTEDRMRINIKSTSTGDNFYITLWREYPPGQAAYFMDTEPTGQKTLANITWDTYYLPCGYRDGVNDAPCVPTYGLQAESSGILYTITLGNQSSTTEI